MTVVLTVSAMAIRTVALRGKWSVVQMVDKRAAVRVAKMAS
jgi:hypothetical protein